MKPKLMLLNTKLRSRMPTSTSLNQERNKPFFSSMECQLPHFSNIVGLPSVKSLASYLWVAQKQKQKNSSFLILLKNEYPKGNTYMLVVKHDGWRTRNTNIQIRGCYVITFVCCHLMVLPPHVHIPYYF